MKHIASRRIVRYILYYVLLVIVSIGVGYLVQEVSFIKAFDRYFYTHIHGLPHNKIISQFLSPFDLWFFPLQVIFFLPAYFYFVLGGFFIYMGIFRKTELVEAIISMILGFVLAGILLGVDWHFIFRHRPFESLPSTVDAVSKQILAKSPSYPSGHVRDTTVVSTIIAQFIPRIRFLMILFIAFIAFTRVYTGEIGRAHV